MIKKMILKNLFFFSLSRIKKYSEGLISHFFCITIRVRSRNEATKNQMIDKLLLKVIVLMSFDRIKSKIEIKNISATNNVSIKVN